MTCDYDSIHMICDWYITLSYAMWQFVTVTYDIILNPNSKFQNKKQIKY